MGIENLHKWIVAVAVVTVILGVFGLPAWLQRSEEPKNSQTSSAPPSPLPCDYYLDLEIDGHCVNVWTIPLSQVNLTTLEIIDEGDYQVKDGEKLICIQINKNQSVCEPKMLTFHRRIIEGDHPEHVECKRVENRFSIPNVVKQEPA